MGEKVRQVPREEFIALWNAAGSLDEVAAQILARVGPRVPRWVVMARAAELRRDGATLRALVPKQALSTDPTPPAGRCLPGTRSENGAKPAV
ncbi:hypothetical protein VT84_06465 [Gemmata sp. SH-PL17]|uniref:hypothetical protein n=1 Tax=Gemmata sp. SH-PL17 TaxID=1630693 RepID=UPI00078E4D92|nr:hypothetical protein [Gemmata sp. SH-PL17]AMV24020.1 hypothetical protein VT84_06465 [Gemmata sp. SH-PL17]